MNIAYTGAGDWKLENAQRNAISQGLADAAPDDLIFISDLDEIWSPDILQRINNRQEPLLAKYTSSRLNKRIIIPCKLLIHAADFLNFSPIALEQEHHNYYMDWIAKFTWHGTVLTRFKNLTTPQALRNLRDHFPFLRNGGWHFSWMGDVEMVLKKMTAVVEGNAGFSEKDSANLTDRNYLKQMLESGRLFWRADAHAQMLHYDISKINLPYLGEFVKKYPQFLKPQS